VRSPARAWTAPSLPLLALLLAPPLLALLLAPPLGAQVSGAHTHLAHVTSAFDGTPAGRGLAVTTAEEISLAMMHANLAAANAGDLASLKAHARHVLHLLDPEEVAEGPGLGFGVVAGAQTIQTHIELAAGSDGASQSLRTHAAHVSLAARAVIARAGAAAELARQVQSAATAAEAAALVEEMRAKALQLDTGEDVNGSGGLDLDGIEGGFGQLEDHVYLALEQEGLPRILR